MLKGLNPILSPDLLFTLRAMGHGDEIAIVDGNYPGLEHGRRLVRLDGLNLIAVLDAILSVLPVDTFVPEAIFRATKDNDAGGLEPVHQEIIDCCKRHEPEQRVVPLPGAALYSRIKAAHTIVQTSERRLYGNVILRKGVIYP